MLLIPICYSSIQHQLLSLLSGRAGHSRVQRYPDRRHRPAFLRRYVQQAIAQGMTGTPPGPWRLGWQRHSWAVGDARTPQVVCGEYRLACDTPAEAGEIRAMLNWYRIPEPHAPDRRVASRGRRPRFDRRGRELRAEGQLALELAAECEAIMALRFPALAVG
jgi:hypothetical protein